MPLLLFIQLVLVDPHLAEAVGLVEGEQDEGDDQEHQEHAEEDRPTFDDHACEAYKQICVKGGVIAQRPFLV